MFDSIRRDIKVVLERDPAARSPLEVFFCYPGVHALAIHRLAHRLWEGAGRRWRGSSHVSRFATESRSTGSRLGRRLFIDHGMGVVIGRPPGRRERHPAAGRHPGARASGAKRHPTLGDNVVVGAGATVLGAITIGDNSRIGAGSVVVRDVPANAVVVGVPGKVTYRDGQRVSAGIDLNQTDLPDPVAKAIEHLVDRIRILEQEVDALRRSTEAERFE
jgi:serine O-acetyltransferase